MILAKNLMLEFSKEIGRKLARSSDNFPVFRMMVIIDSSISAGEGTPEKNSWQTLWKCGESVSMKVR